MESLPCSPDLEASCALCRDDVFHCHEVSVVYLDGAIACGDPWCTLPHHLHEWQETESTVVTPMRSCRVSTGRSFVSAGEAA